jgi:uncharacterized protein YyaL (SSP411 family)
MNRLAKSTSPYLLQHQHNPVDWYEWGPEAFEAARSRNIPIFLSVGYSTCYWCHVMERESFESPEIAAIMNERFVCIKVDREQRPDVDEIYMAAVQAFTHRGGWPMSVFLEPASLKPFWAGTYFPAKPAFQGIPTFPQVLTSISEAWTTQRDDVLKQSQELAEAVAERVNESAQHASIGAAQVTGAVSRLIQILDRTNGGFGSAPKFPQPVFLDLLQDTRDAAANEETKGAIDHALRLTLTRMAEGGMFDQVGGGFHRYSVDERWIVPHFEKMLYDNGLLAWTYSRAFESFRDPLFARTARRICEYILREMVSPEGAFFSAQDAEVNHREGLNYLWTKDQLVATLGKDDGEWIANIYAADQGPNFQDPHHPPTPEHPASNVLHIAPEHSTNLWTDELSVARLNALNAKLLEARATREQPRMDTKVITGWNGLMIAGLARAGKAVDEPRFIVAAERAWQVISERLLTSDGRLLRCLYQGRAEIDAFLEDYAFICHALIELARARPEAAGTYLDKAVALASTALVLFGDEHGALFDAQADQPDLFIRARSTADGAVPAGASVLTNVLIDVALARSDDAPLQVQMFDRAGKLLRALSGEIAAAPLNTANSTRALLRLLTNERGPVSSALAQGPTAIPTETFDPDANPVEIFADADQVTLNAGDAASFTLHVRIAPGFHINAAEPGAPNLVPFRIHMLEGEGVKVYADYPEGEPLGSDSSVRVYSGEFDLPIALEREGEWKDTPLIGVTFQACTDTACLEPMTAELDVVIDRA